MHLIDFLTSVVLPAFVGGGAAWALLHFFGQRLVDHRLSKDLEKYRVELGERTETLKMQLSIFAHEQNVAASRVDVQRANAISKVYACIRDVINPVSSIVSGSPIMNGTEEQSVQFYLENARIAHASCGVLVNTLADLAIYFDNETYVKIVALAKVSMDASGKYLDSLIPLVANGRSAKEILQVAEAGRVPLRDQVQRQLTVQAKQLTSQFREQLGIERPKNSGKSP